MLRSPLIFILCSLLTALCHAQPVSLFDGKTLEGWDYDPAVWRVEDGCITGGSTTEKIPKNFFISTQKSFMNFELRLKIKCSGDPKTGMINSGIQIRSVRDGTAMSGYQIDCGAGWFGKIYDEHRRNKVIWSPTPEQQAALDKVLDVFGWNEYVIRAEGPRIQTWINGVHCIDYTETDPHIALDGHIAPQVHSGGVCLVQVKDITVEELPPTPSAPTWKSVGSVGSKKRDISYNSVHGAAKTAEEQLKLFHLPEGYEIELVAQESEDIGKFISVYFDQRGRLWTQTALEYPVDANENPAAAEALYAGKGRDKVLVYPRESLSTKIPPGGLKNPTVFADGLAIPLGILPWGAGDTCYVQHGHVLKLYKDTDGNGRADSFDVLLTGFGVQDSHLFPHQFTRAPGGWIWMAQGLFNHSQVRKPGSDVIVDWPKCSMARMRPDGSAFEVISTGPNNIWGLVITGEGEAFIQEANDYGYPVMPFHEYAYYPGGMEALKMSYQPDFPPQADFRMGGTGLSGLVLIESGPLSPREAAAHFESAPHHVMAVANPIISKVQTIAMHRQSSHPSPSDEPRHSERDGHDYWKLSQLPDLVTCDDPFFRPVALTNGPDGCIYIVDWYNKIISHNEVPRNHPERDKTRGRIWRVKCSHHSPSDGPRHSESDDHSIPDFTALPDAELTAMLGQPPIGRAHLAWQTLQDRGALPADHWAAREYMAHTRIGQICQIGRNLTDQSIPALLAFAKPSLPGPTIQSSNRPRQIPVREAYDREFERFLVRMFLERHPDLVARFLDSEASAKLPLEGRVLASLALEPRASASRVARLLPQLDRAPNEEELLRLAQFPDEPGVGEALQALLANETSRASVAEKLLAQGTRLNAALIAPVLTRTARVMLKGPDPAARKLAFQLASGFVLRDLDDDLVLITHAANANPDEAVLALNALESIGSKESTHLVMLYREANSSAVRDAAVAALAKSRNPEAPAALIHILGELKLPQRRGALEALSGTPHGAQALVAALAEKKLPPSDLDDATVERLASVLGEGPELKTLQQTLGGVFREVLVLDGSDDAWVDSKITLDGPFTVECWVRLAPGIGNEDCILGVPGGIQLNFFQSRFRIYAGPELHDVCVASKPITPDMWTHLAVTRDENGICRIYQNGELDAAATRPAAMRWENCRIGWSGPAKGTQGALMEFRVLNRAKTAEEARAGFDRTDPTNQTDLSHLKKGARLVKTLDTPPLLTEEQARALDAKFAKYTALAATGDAQVGKPLAALCIACHQIGAEGGQIGPNLSGVGAMGLEAVLRNILTPNAAMEPGYRIFRVQLNSGELLDTFFVSEDTEALVIRQVGVPDRRLPKAEVASSRFIRRSLMPEGLLDALNDTQAADLLAFLMTLQ